VSNRYDEAALLGDVESHLKITIEQTTSKMEIPVDEFDGKVVYGKKRGTGGSNQLSYVGHADVLAPTVQQLQDLERTAQSSFLLLSNNISSILNKA